MTDVRSKPNVVSGRWGRDRLGTLLVIGLFLPLAQGRAAERVQLTTGFFVDCLRHETAASADHLRLILPPSEGDSGESYLEIRRSTVLSIEALPEKPAASSATFHPDAKSGTGADLKPMLAEAERLHRVDADLLASVVHAESAGNARAVSRTGARGLMQLMPSTAAELGVRDAFAPEQNIDGGSSYLDQLLTRYHDNIAFALAAYNAGPAAVDRFHGIPPFRETQLYVARVIREFNRRKLALRNAAAPPVIAIAPILSQQAFR